VAAVKAGIKALLVNKIGDLFLLTAISLIYLSTKTLDFDIIFNSIGLLEQSKYYFLFFNVAALDLICILFVLAACVKSAQLFFHIWLADAMEGPTPVSALLHAATMVTAGVFLLIRFSFIIEWSPVAMNLIVYFGAVTILFSGVIGLFQYDIKKIIAYSTCSQLGFMFLACGLSGYTLALYHFFNHAFFKALLFLSAGIIIHNLKNEQDIRKMGGLFKLFPFTFTMFLISSLSLSGFPFFAGYFSKDSILMLLYARAQLNGEFIIIYYLIMISLFITCFYSFKIIYYVFINKINVNKNIHLAGIKENLNFFTAVPMFSLAVLSVLSGALFKDYFIGGGANFFYEASIFIKPDNVNYFLFFKEQRLITLFIIVLSYTICILFSRYKYAIFEKKWFKSLEDKRRIYTFFIKKAAFDDIYNIVFNSKVYFYSRRLYEVFEKGLLLLLGPEGLYNNLKKISLYIKKKFNDGSIESLIFHFLLSVFFVLLVVFLNI
jgi:NADH-quinone oxidoreductase subunit L